MKDFNATRGRLLSAPILTVLIALLLAPGGASAQDDWWGEDDDWWEEESGDAKSPEKETTTTGSNSAAESGAPEVGEPVPDQPPPADVRPTEFAFNYIDFSDKFALFYVQTPFEGVVEIKVWDDKDKLVWRHHYLRSAGTHHCRAPLRQFQYGALYDFEVRFKGETVQESFTYQ